MNKRTFIKLCSAAATSCVIRPLMLAWAAGNKLKNWAGNFEYGTERVYSPHSLDEMREFVRKQNRLKVLGTRHCFSKIADSTYQFLSLKTMGKVVELDAKARTVTVEAGMTYGHLCPYLDSKGWALHNLASLPHISIAGACSTATHGSRDKNGSLATAVSALEIVNAASDVVKLSRHSQRRFRSVASFFEPIGRWSHLKLINGTWELPLYLNNGGMRAKEALIKFPELGSR